MVLLLFFSSSKHRSRLSSLAFLVFSFLMMPSFRVHTKNQPPLSVCLSVLRIITALLFFPKRKSNKFVGTTAHLLTTDYHPDDDDDGKLHKNTLFCLHIIVIGVIILSNEITLCRKRTTTTTTTTKSPSSR